jgi:ABC-type uncharacterized transport system substrate-binding protein
MSISYAKRSVTGKVINRPTRHSAYWNFMFFSHKALALKRLALQFLMALLALSTGIPIALAHPHVLVSVQSELIFNEAEELIAVRHHWRFDEGFSAYMLQGLDENQDGVYSREELEELAQINVESLADYAFFTDLIVATSQEELDTLPGVKFESPENYWLEHDGQAATLHYDLPLSEARPLNQYTHIALDVFDPEYFIAFSLSEEEPFRIGVSSPQCEASVSHPPPMSDRLITILAAIPPDGAVPEDIAQITAGLRNRMSLICV